ncbi:MAG: WD40/YVTN/BNR-like repeat-containing protein [Candidatus Cyclobacteriaceae bacterium M2_1C_046]
MKNILLMMFIFSVGFNASAQKIDMKHMVDMEPRSIGPAGMSGRVTAIDVVTENPDIIYAGTASGGLWKSESGGIDWMPIFDEQPVASIGAVAIQQSNPSVIWVGTGEGNPRNSLNGGYGIYRTLDAGRTWELMGLEKTRHIHRVIIDPTDPDVVYVAAIGSPWGEHPERGIYKTTDGGKSWNRILFTNEKSGAADLVMDPTNPNKLIAAMWEHKREPWFFNSGGPGSGLFVTHDGGETWSRKTEKDGLPKGELGRIGLAISRSNPKIIYALVESKKNALYRSEDGGFSWKMINDKGEIGNRPFYYSEIYVDPNNENRLYSLFSYVNVSEDGGRSFNMLMPAYGTDVGIHPDHHAWYIHPENSSFMIDGNDGGLNITRDRGQTWRFVETLPLAQFYHISVDNETPYNIYGGMQDNGSWVGPAYVWKTQGIRNSYWQEVMFGDGFDVVPDPENSRYGYAMSQQGNVGRYDRLTGYTKTIKPTHPDPEVRLRFNWNAAIAQDPFDPNTIYYGSQFVHKSSNKGNSWEIISPDLTTDDPEKQKQHESGGLTIDATGAENYTTILAIEPSTLEAGVLWVGTDDGNVQVSRDGGKSWTNVAPNISGLPAGSWIPQIRASRYNNGEAYVVSNDYRRFNYTPYLFKTTDYGKSWSRIVDENDVFGYTLSFIQDPVEPNLMFLGTEDGLYVSIDGAANWTKWTRDYPSVPTMDLAIQEKEHDLVIGTYGRAAYVLDDIRPLRAMAKENVTAKELDLFTPPDAYVAEYQQPVGSRFGANAMFNGENRPYGAHISYWVQVPSKDVEKEGDKEDKKSKKKKKDREPEEEKPVEDKVKRDSVYVHIYNGQNELIRTLKRKTPDSTGIYRMTWYMDEAGVRYPSRQKRRNSSNEPGGVTVLPGTYKIVMLYGDKKDSADIKVSYDPRLETDDEVHKAKYDALKELEQKVDKASRAVTQLVESRELADDFENRLKDLKKLNPEADVPYDSLIKESKAVKDSIRVLIDTFLGEEDERQGIIRSPDPNVMSYLSSARYYVGSTLEVPGPTEERLMDQADRKLKPALEKVNEFYQTQWQEYQRLMQQQDLTYFKKYEPIEWNEE